MATNYDTQLQAAQRQYESECDCCDHGRKSTQPDDGDIYDGGWTIGGKRQPVISVAEANRRYQALVAGGAL